MHLLGMEWSRETHFCCLNEGARREFQVVVQHEYRRENSSFANGKDAGGLLLCSLRARPSCHSGSPNSPGGGRIDLETGIREAYME
jgi:hypothetical protein